MRFILYCFVLLISVHASAQKNLQLLGQYTYPGFVSTSNLTGYADTAGREYALVGTTQGLSIVDITNPATPTQLFLVPGATGPQAAWREVREYNGFAYVTTEQTSGLVVVDLRFLPDSIGYHTINPMGLKTSHTIFIDENGIAYVNGTDKGLIFLDLNANPWNPQVVGAYTNYYVHDCYARNDTLWAACINDGFVITIDVADKATTNAPSKVLAQWNTPQNFSHNCWLSDDGKYLFTTDERPASFLTCYDVSDLNNVREIDRTQIQPGSNTVIHNTYFKNNFCITSYYTYGVTIHDVARKNNLIEVANYDTSPAFSGDGFNGAWGVWPYLPSGNIIVSDIETGLWIFKPTYKRAAYLEGVVRDSVCNTLMNNVLIEIIGAGVTDKTNIQGRYATGTVDSGTYTIRFSKAGYQTKEFTGVSLQNGLLTTINVQMLPLSTSNFLTITQDTQQLPVPFVRVLVQDTSATDYLEYNTDASGRNTACDFLQGDYSFYAGRWGWVTKETGKQINSISDSVVTVLTRGYYDDFIMDYGWTVNSTASAGLWTRAVPNGTFYNNQLSNPDADVPDDFGKRSYVTGNSGVQAGDDDIDNGATTLRSPLFALNTYQNPYISYYRWFFNDGGQGSAPNDSLIVTLDNGFNKVVVDSVGGNDGSSSQWKFVKFRVKDFTFLTANMRLEVTAFDKNPGHLVEAGFDMFMVTDSAEFVDTSTSIANLQQDLQWTVYPNPFGSQLQIKFGSVAQSNDILLIRNLLGETVFSWPVTGQEAFLRFGKELSAGVYVIQWVRGNQLVDSQKLIKL